MGWARYAHSMRIFVLNSGLFYLRWVHAHSCLARWLSAPCFSAPCLSPSLRKRCPHLQLAVVRGRSALAVSINCLMASPPLLCCPASPPSPITPFPTCRPTPAATELIDKIIYRVETENGWDQALFNECIFFPNRPGYKVGVLALMIWCVACWPVWQRHKKCNSAAGTPAVHLFAPPIACRCRLQDPAVTRRVLDYMLFMNSKVLFKHLRHDAGQYQSHMPVSVHVNYHPGGWVGVRRMCVGWMVARMIG
jgi:hypothetical protein